MSVVGTYIRKFKKQIQNLSIYLLASLIPMMVSMICNPFVAKNMSPTDYAITGYYSAFNSLLFPFVSFYLINYYTKRYFEFDDQRRAIVKATIFKMLIFFSLLLFLIALVGVYIYTIHFNKESQLPFMPYALMALLPLPLGGIYSLNLVEFRMERNSKRFFKYSVTKGLLNTGLLVLFVVFFKWGAFGSLSSSLMITILFFVVILYQNKDLWKIPFDRGMAKEAIVFCWPLVIAAMLNFFSNGYDKVILERAGNVAMLGIYSVGVSIARHLHVFSSSINDTFQPDIYENIVKHDFSRCAKFIVIKLTLMVSVVLLFIVFSPILVKVLTYGRYVAATPFCQILSLASITSMMYFSMSQVTIALGYSSITLLNKILGSILSIISFSILIPAFGAYGAAWGAVLCYFYFFLGNVVMVTIKYKRTHKA